MDGRSKIAVRLNMLGCACADMPVGYVEPIGGEKSNKLKKVHSLISFIRKRLLVGCLHHVCWGGWSFCM